MMARPNRSSWVTSRECCWLSIAALLNRRANRLTRCTPAMKKRKAQTPFCE